MKAKDKLIVGIIGLHEKVGVIGGNGEEGDVGLEGTGVVAVAHGERDQIGKVGDVASNNGRHVGGRVKLRVEFVDIILFFKLISYLVINWNDEV